MNVGVLMKLIIHN